jgi:hypothetical protein
MEKYLAKFSKKNFKGEFVSTHTRIPDKELCIYPGNFCIKNKEEFWEKYYKEVIENNEDSYLTETQDENGVIAIDLDFRYNHEVAIKQHDEDTVQYIICCLIEPLKQFYVFDEKSKFEVYVMEKPSVNQLENGSLTKDGIHIIIGLNMPNVLRTNYRTLVIKKLNEYQEQINLPLINDWESVVDEGVLKTTTNWNLYGSKKPAHQAYRLTNIYEIGYDTRDKNFSMSKKSFEMNFELFKKLTIQNLDRPHIAINPNAESQKTTAKKQYLDKANSKPLSTVKECKERELLKIIKLKDSDRKNRKIWMSICSFIITNKSLDEKDWFDFCVDNELNFDKEKEELYTKLTPLKVEIYYLQFLAKQSNQSEYQEWFKKWEIDNNDKSARFASTDDEASDIIFNELKDVFKSYKGRLFYLHNHIWSHEEDKINDIVLNYILKSNIYIGMNEKTNKPIPYTQNVSKAKKVQEALYSKIRVNNDDAQLYEKFHKTTKTKLCFDDGILDFKAKTFTLWENVEPNTVFPTVKINRNYAEYFNNPNQNIIDEIKSKIFNVLYGDKTDTALQYLSRAIAGHHEDKRWATYLGNRNSGKGVEYDLLAGSFEGYVSTFELGNMLYCRKTAGTENIDCSKKLYWLIDLEFVRLAISQEVPDSNSGLVANSKILKKITGGGDVMVARRNYDRKDTHFKIDTSFYIKGNNTLVCDNVDCDETRLEFCSVTQFKTQEEIDFMKNENRDENEMKRYKLADPSIKDKCLNLEWKNAIVYLLYQNYSNKTVEIKKPIDVEDNTLIGALKSSLIFSYKPDHYELVTEVHSFLSSFDKGKIALELNAMNIFKKKVTGGKDKSKWAYYGIQIKTEEEKIEV